MSILLKALQILGQSAVEIVRTKAEILALDVREARIRFVSILLLGAFAFLLISIGILLALFWLILTFWETDRIMVIGVLTGSVLIVGLILLVVMMYKLRKGRGLLFGTIAELDRDYEALGGRGRRRN